MVQPDDPNVDTAYCDLGNRAYILVRGLARLHGINSTHSSSLSMLSSCPDSIQMNTDALWEPVKAHESCRWSFKMNNH